VGYGLVIGLNGTGDRSLGNRGAVFTVQSISNMLERFGLTVPTDQLRTRNVAAVMVTAMTPAFARKGTRFDVTASSLGDATSLEGGVLLATPLMTAAGSYTGQAQGPLSIGGFNIETESGEKYRQNYALVGRVPSGGVMEVSPPQMEWDQSKPLRFHLMEPDFVTASRISEVINKKFAAAGEDAGKQPKKTKLARPVSPGIVELALPDTIESQEQMVVFVASIETLAVQPDREARVVINERTGTVVVGGNVVVGEVLISHGNITIHTRRTPIISQPSEFSSAGETVVESITETEVIESETRTAVISETTSVNDLAAALNDLGVRPRDIIAIFQAIQQAGALNARLIIM